MSDVVLETRSLVKRFGGLVATNDVSLKVMKGARHALIGPNGAGKTTLINLLTGVLEPTGGSISLDVLAFDRSADVLLMLVIGGVGWLYGGVAGAIVFKLLQTWLSAVTPQYWMFWIGLILVLLVLVGRDRLLKPWKWFGARKAVKP